MARLSLDDMGAILRQARTERRFPRWMQGINAFERAQITIDKIHILAG